MQYTRETALKKLLESYQAYFNIHMVENEPEGLVAVCDFFERSEKYVLSRKAELWSANCEEFIYLWSVEHLTLELFEKIRDFTKEKGFGRANIGPGHMYTYITPIILCDTCDDAAKKAVKKCRIYKSFRFSLHGWVDFHIAVFEAAGGSISTNRSGKCVEKILKKILFQKKRR